MSLHQSIENARAERIGAEGVAAADFAEALARTAGRIGLAARPAH